MLWIFKCVENFKNWLRNVKNCGLNTLKFDTFQAHGRIYYVFIFIWLFLVANCREDIVLWTSQTFEKGLKVRIAIVMTLGSFNRNTFKTVTCNIVSPAELLELLIVQIHTFVILRMI